MAEPVASTDRRTSPPSRDGSLLKQDDTSGPGGAANRVDVLGVPYTVVSRLIPRGPVPVAGAGALAVAGVIEWPLAAGIGLGYLALRRWH